MSKYIIENRIEMLKTDKKEENSVKEIDMDSDTKALIETMAQSIENIENTTLRLEKNQKNMIKAVNGLIDGQRQSSGGDGIKKVIPTLNT